MSKKIKSVIIDKPFNALNEKHQLIADTFEDKHQVLIGSSGTGKTFTSLRLALGLILKQENDYHQIIIVRSSVPTRDVGFLKGGLDEKMSVYEAPYSDIVNVITKPMPQQERESYASNYDKLKDTGRIKFANTSYLRGLTFDNAIVILDEVQSATFHEIDTVLTRLGNKSKLVMCGDFKQDDLKRGQSGLHEIMKILVDMVEHFNIIQFTPWDVIRSGFVRDYLIAKEEMCL